MAIVRLASRDARVIGGSVLAVDGHLGRRALGCGRCMPV